MHPEPSFSKENQQEKCFKNQSQNPGVLGDGQVLGQK
jgi:hypothetical protein